MYRYFTYFKHLKEPKKDLIRSSVVTCFSSRLPTSALNSASKACRIMRKQKKNRNEHDYTSNGKAIQLPRSTQCTVGNPTFLASRDLVVSLYNQSNPGNAVSNYCQRAKEWFISEALSVGWSNALETGNGLGILLHLQLNIPQFQPQDQLPPGV